MIKPRGAKRLVLVGSITLITALVWVAIDSYHQLIKQEQLLRVNLA